MSSVKSMHQHSGAPCRFVTIRRLFFVLLLAVPLSLPAEAYAQSSDARRDTTAHRYGSGAGFQVVVTNSGFGLGAYLSRSLSRQYSFIAEMTIGSEKSDREVKFFGLGQSFIPDKANYFLRIPVRIGVQRRLWEDYIEDNFRPYLQFTTGPTLGWIYPYFDDANGNETYDREERRYDGFGSLLKGEFRLGVGGVIGLGANFGENSRLTQGVRISYSFNYFFNTIQLLESDEQIEPARYFGSPTISITFGRLL